MKSFEQTGLQQNAKINPDCGKASNSQALLIIHQQDGEEQESIFGNGSIAKIKMAIRTLSLCITLGSSGISIKASFDFRSTKPLAMQRLLWQLKILVLSLHKNTTSSNKTLRELQILPLSDLQTLWTWKSAVTDYIDKLLHSMIEDQAQLNSTAPAIHFRDENFTYSGLDRFSSNIASHLMELGLESGIAVPLCLEKSKWTIVSLFALLKASGAFVLQDASLLERMLQSIVE